MKQTEESLLKRNRLAATIGQELTLEVLKEFREQFTSQLKASVPSSSDPHAYNMHRILGRIEAIDYLINQGEMANKPQNNNKKD